MLLYKLWLETLQYYKFKISWINFNKVGLINSIFATIIWLKKFLT